MRRTGDEKPQTKRNCDPLFNPKRRLREWSSSEADRANAERLAQVVRYKGNPAHKKNPGDFCLTPPAAPRPNATLCDEAGLSQKEEALYLLRQGARQGLVDQRFKNGFPVLIWAVRANDGTVFEAQLENEGLGDYHGYPMAVSDPFRLIVMEAARGR